MKGKHTTENNPVISGGMSRGKPLHNAKPNNPEKSRELDGQGRPDRRMKHSRVLTNRER